MTDINTIKNLLDFIPYLKTETWYMLSAALAMYLIYIIYVRIFERYYKTPNHIPEIIIPPSIHDIIAGLSVEDAHFFEKLSLMIRTYLEESEKVALATKKTQGDIRKEAISKDLKDILEICAYHEYTSTDSDVSEKKKILSRLRDLL